jgi:hypothetical protein
MPKTAPRPLFRRVKIPAPFIKSPLRAACAQVFRAGGAKCPFRPGMPVLGRHSDDQNKSPDREIYFSPLIYKATPLYPLGLSKSNFHLKV